MKKIKIKDIYAGKPDAKDEINFDGYDEFIKAFIIPENFNFNGLMEGNCFYITGYKGTGKTALLFYLDTAFRNKDLSSCSSFIFFKEDYTDLKKSEIDNISKRLLSSVKIEKDTLLHNSDFEYIWRWLFFKRIVSDNMDFNMGLFVDDEYWSNFVKYVGSIKGPSNIKKSIIPSNVKVAFPFVNLSSGDSFTPELEIDFQNNSQDNNLEKFISIIDAAEEAFSKVRRTDIPYYIFVDELEAYYGDQTIFFRDLYLIRDLLFTVKRFNSIFSSSSMKNTKIICSVRTEILQSISRNIVTKELNKVISGFECPLKWNYNNTNSFAHPILQILLRRIAISEVNGDEAIRKEKDIIASWFPDNIHDIDPASYILNNSWCKPRDIVRLILTSQNSLDNENYYFSTAVFLSSHKQYSLDSLEEIKEELRALYTNDEISMIVNCFTGFKSRFKVKDLRNRIELYFKGTIVDTNFIQVLNDLYRLSFIGNCIPSLNMYRWSYKGDDTIILSEEWYIMIHQGLQAALSLGRRQDNYIAATQPPQIGATVVATIKSIKKSFINVAFSHYGKEKLALIHISQVNGKYIKNLSNLYSVGDQLNAKILSYDEKRSKWLLTLL